MVHRLQKPMDNYPFKIVRFETVRKIEREREGRGRERKGEGESD